MEIRALQPSDAESCDAIILSLPYHFAIEEGRRMCAEAVRSQHGFVAVDDGNVIGFLTMVDRFSKATDITWLAVRDDRRRTGVGHALVERLVEHARTSGRTILTVLTVSPNDPDDTPEPPDGYQSTRTFYEQAGFQMVHDLPGYFGPDSDLPVLMVMPLKER